MKNLLKKIFLTIMVLLALYKVTSFSQTVSETTVSSDKEKSTVSLNKDFILYKNEPEVFSDLTLIKFDIVNQGNVKMNIYNAGGEKIETLVDGEMEPGIYSVYFKRYEELQPGEYFYELDVNGNNQRNSMFITK